MNSEEIVIVANLMDDIQFILRQEMSGDNRYSIAEWGMDELKEFRDFLISCHPEYKFVDENFENINDDLFNEYKRNVRSEWNSQDNDE